MTVKRGYQPLFSKRYVFYAISSLKARFDVHSALLVESEIAQQLTLKTQGDLILYFQEIFRGIDAEINCGLEFLGLLTFSPTIELPDLCSFAIILSFNPCMVLLMDVVREAYARALPA